MKFSSLKGCYRDLQMGVRRNYRNQELVLDYIRLAGALLFVPVLLLFPLGAALLYMEVFVASFLVSVVFEEARSSSRFRMSVALLKVQMFPSRISIGDAVVLSRLECWGRCGSVGSGTSECCVSCSPPNWEMRTVLSDSKVGRRVSLAHARVFPEGGDSESRFRGAMAAMSGDLLEVRTVSCCFGHRFAALDVPLDVAEGFVSDRSSSELSRGVLRMILAPRYLAAGPWWEGTPEASRFSRLVTAIAAEPDHTLQAASGLAGEWSQGPEDLLRVARIVSGDPNG